MIGAVLGLIVIFLLLSSRNSGSHPRDMHTGRFHDTHEDLRPIIKEPPGKWDPFEDKFQDEPSSRGHKVKGLQEQLEEIQRQAFDLPDEGIQRKPLRKGGDQDTRKLEDKAKGQLLVESEPKKFGVGGSGAVVIGKEEANVNRYDPAAGLPFGKNAF